jgi:hypothetical protein
MTKDEALKLALDALDEPHEVQFWNKQEKAIKAIKEALAQQEPEYLAFMDTPQCTWVEIDDEDFSKALELCDFDKVAAFEFFEDKLRSKSS